MVQAMRPHHLSIFINRIYVSHGSCNPSSVHDLVCFIELDFIIFSASMIAGEKQQNSMYCLHQKKAYTWKLAKYSKVKGPE